MPEKKHIELIDILKGIAILSVRHCNSIRVIMSLYHCLSY